MLFISYIPKVFSLVILCASFCIPLAAQRSKSKTSDEFGILAGININPYYPRDQNRRPVRGGNPEVLPAAMAGLSYYRDPKGRFAHVFQLRLSGHQLKYWKSTRQTWSYNGDRVTVKQDTGQYHIRYADMGMNYMLGYCLHKKSRWHVYGGLQLNYTVHNRSTKTVDRVINGELDGFDYVPYPVPVYIYKETSKTYSQDAGGEIIFRTDGRIHLNKQWGLRPVLEYAFDPGVVHVSIRGRWSGYLEIYRTL